MSPLSSTRAQLDSTLADLPPIVRGYISEVDVHCQKMGVDFKMGIGGRVRCDYGLCGGYFDEGGEPRPVLAIAVGRRADVVLGTLLHEYCHSLQWADKSSIWHDEENTRYFERFDPWLQGSRCHHPRRIIQSCIDLEWDNEWRAWNRVRPAWSSLITKKSYAQQANAYLYMYAFTLQVRRWSNDSVYLNSALVAEAPDKLLACPRQYWDIPAGVQRELEKHFGVVS